MLKVGIRHEDKYLAETRTPLVPSDIEQLIKNTEIQVILEPSAKRVFSNESFEVVGAQIGEIDGCDLIIGVKEVPVQKILTSKIYLIFSHVIKGQKENMPALKKMMELKVSLIDYEKIVDEKGKRLIFFGRYAGLAGMINGLWCLGKRLDVLGVETPFLHIRQARTYSSLDEARQAIIKVGEMISSGGMDKLTVPIVIGFTGYGNVSKGAWEIMDLLPVVTITPEDLMGLQVTGNWDRRAVYKVVFDEKHLVKPIDPDNSFDLQDYYSHPEKYINNFEQYLDKITVLVNGTYWDARYPRLVTKSYLKTHYHANHPLKVIADISCDINGSIECTDLCTKPENPVFVYEPLTEKIRFGFDHAGLLVLAVDILPSELPKDSSIGFSSVLMPFIKELDNTDFSVSFDELDVPFPIKKAIILYHGQLTPEYRYLEKYID